MLRVVPTPDPENETPVQRFRVPVAAWNAFGRVCTERGVRRARRLFDLMWGDIRRYGTEEDRAAFAAADRELRQRRSRRPRP
jgi:hypothetical protein